MSQIRTVLDAEHQRRAESGGPLADATVATFESRTERIPTLELPDLAEARLRGMAWGILCPLI